MQRHTHPLLMMMPSARSRMPSKCDKLCLDAIFAMIFVFFIPIESRYALR